MDIRQLEDALMQGRERVNQYQDEFYNNFYGEAVRNAVLASWNSLPAEVKQRLQAMNPQAYHSVEQALKKEK